MKNHIEEYLLNKIELNQKILFSEFMNLSLYHPDYGYYTNKSNIFGDQGDFITSPITSSINKTGGCPKSPVKYSA